MHHPIRRTTLRALGLGVAGVALACAKPTCSHEDLTKAQPSRWRGVAG